MLLAIDSGNTNTVFALFEGSVLRESWRIMTNPRRTADEFAMILHQFLTLSHIPIEKIIHAVIGNVVPETLSSLRDFCQRYLNLVREPIEIGSPEVDPGIVLALDYPQEIGADRVANAVGVRERHGVPAIVVDFGTATNLDVVDAQGRYIGGVIAPGMQASIEALHRAAAKLPRVEVAPPRDVIGQSTVDAMRSGAFWGHLGMVEGLIQRIHGELGCAARVIALGGLAPSFVNDSALIDRHDPDLTLHGLRLIYDIQSFSS